MTPLFIIPARGGSKGIPRKNIKMLGPRPLIAYAIECARKSGADDRHILLSTDDAEIAEVARREGLPVEYMRPAELASDTAGSREMMLDAIDWAVVRGIDFDCVVLLQPTSPFRIADDVSGALALFRPGVDMVVSVCEAKSNPYYNLFETRQDGTLSLSKGDGSFTRRQDAPKVWKYNGAVYVINPDSLRRWPMSQFPVIVPYEMPADRSVDLDTQADWIVAEAMLAARTQPSSSDKR